MKKIIFLSVLLLLCVSVFAQNPPTSQTTPAPEKRIYVYTTTFDLPNGTRRDARILIDELSGKIKVRFIEPDGRMEKSYDTRDDGSFKPDSGAVLDPELHYAFVFKKQEGGWRAHVLNMTQDAQGKFQFTPHNQPDLKNEHIIPLTKFTGQDRRGKKVEAYFNPCENQIAIMKEGTSVLNPDLFLGGSDFTGMRSTTPPIRTIFNYFLSYRKEEDVNGRYRVGMAWDNDHANEIRLNLPRQEGTSMTPFHENIDSIRLTSESKVDFNDCLQAKLRGAENIVSHRTEEVEEHSSCGPGQEKLLEELKGMVDSIQERRWPQFRDPDDAFDWGQ